MTAMPDDDWLRSLRPQPKRVSAEEYEALPEEIARTIEVVDGYVVFCAAPTPEHQRVVRRLTTLVERYAREAMDRGHPCVEVDFDIDLRLRDVPFLNRRPDVVLYQCLDRESREGLRPRHVLLVCEVVSPGSETQDTVDKLGEYARAGIPHYWIVRTGGTGVSVIERYQLDRAAGLYKHVGTFMKEAGGEPKVNEPLPVTITWSELEY
ncbi:Uma2 family endonuclease [Actinomadura logoneensis]|uniref:Uma2 family endonuclease n=2 Tax=Actinomadura logoneensis TaxID=2293572 RepID=A0A372JND9_9ACTN|nr:Uma2 family endonuclease [Actinomadura logoneensis]